MPVGIVQATGFSQSHKPMVTIDGQRYSASKCKDVNLIQVGDEIEFDSNQGQWQGQTIWYLNSYKLLKGATKYLDPNRQMPAPMDITAPQTPVGHSQDCIKFCSNVVGHWVAAGGLMSKDYEEIEKVLSAAKNAFKSQFP